MHKPNMSTVTDEQLADFGFPVRIMGKVCGSPVVVREGMDRSAARFAAWQAGFVAMAVTPVPAGSTWAECFGKPKPEPDPEVMAWARN